MNAARILAQAGLDSDELRTELHPVRPEEVNVWPASRLVRMLWRPGISGVTLGRLVLVDPKLMRGDIECLGRLVTHELVHVRQFADQGYLRFMVRYVLEYWSARVRGEPHREAYRGISAEIEAREVAARHV